MRRVLRSRAAIAAVAFVVGVSVADGIAWATIPDSTTGTITACYPTSGTNKGALRVIDYESGQRCAAGEASLSLASTTCNGYPHVSVDWHGCSFRFANLSGQTLMYGHLTGTNFGSANLAGADVDHANLTNANLGSANLSGANLTSANITGAVISNRNLRGTNFVGVSGLTSTQLRGAQRVGGEVDTGVPIPCGLTTLLIFGGAHFDGLNLAGFDLSASFLQFASFKGTTVNGTNFVCAILDEVDFTGQNLTSANFTNTQDVFNTRFVIANLSNANFSGASFNQANLSGATTTGATFTSATWSNTICPDGTNSGSHSNTCAGHL